VLHGQKIKAGDSLMMCYWSANRDEDVFEEPFSFKVNRSPNRHLAFGSGAHICLGQLLANMEVRALFRELLPRLEHVELAGEPAWVQANFVSGRKRLPIRYRMAGQSTELGYRVERTPRRPEGEIRPAVVVLKEHQQRGVCLSRSAVKQNARGHT
jgi:hypothetical protein